MTVFIHTLTRRCRFKTLSVMFMALLLGACSRNQPSAAELLLGSWHVKQGQITRIIVFQKTGSWHSQGRIRDDMNQIIRKTEKVSGKWKLKGKMLKMTGPRPPMKIPWAPSGVNPFEITKISDRRMQIKLASGKTRELFRIKPANPEAGHGVSNILLTPFVVNLRDTAPLGIEHYICIDLNLILKTPQTAVATHPKIREAVIFFLNSKSLDDVDTMEKIQMLRDQLFMLIAPYMNGNLDAVEIKGVTVTSMKAAINHFLQRAALMQEREHRQKK